MECDGYRDKWHDIYEEVTSKLGNNSNTNITDIVKKMMGRSSTSPEFITFREFAIEAKFSKLMFAHLHNYRNIKRTHCQAKFYWNSYAHSGKMCGNITA